MKKFWSKKRIFRILGLGLALLGLFLLLYPFYPRILLWIQNKTDGTKGYEYASELAQQKGEEIDQSELKPIPEDNRLVIPKIQVDSQIIEAQTEQALNRGIWRRPQSSTPNQTGNTVLSGHRFLYRSGPNTLYNLDKIEIGDEIIVFWEKQEFDYKVVEIKEVEVTQVEVEEQTQGKILTIYTCTPIWTSKRRLVIVAEPFEL